MLSSCLLFGVCVFPFTCAFFYHLRRALSKLPRVFPLTLWLFHAARFITGTHQRSQTFYTTPCNGVMSHGDLFGNLRVFADHKRKTNAVTIFARRTAFCACFVFALRIRYMQVTYALDESPLFWLRKKPEDPQIQVHAGIKIWDLWCISVRCIDKLQNEYLLLISTWQRDMDPENSLT